MPAFSNAQRSSHSAGPGMYSPSSAIFFANSFCKSDIQFSTIRFLSVHTHLNDITASPAERLGRSQSSRVGPERRTQPDLQDAPPRAVAVSGSLFRSGGRAWTPQRRAQLLSPKVRK